MHLFFSRSQTVLDFLWRKSLTGLVCRWFTLGSREQEWESGEGQQGRRKSQCIGELLSWVPLGAFGPGSCQASLPGCVCHLLDLYHVVHMPRMVQLAWGKDELRCGAKCSRESKRLSVLRTRLSGCTSYSWLLQQQLDRQVSWGVCRVMKDVWHTPCTHTLANSLNSNTIYFFARLLSERITYCHLKPLHVFD